MTTLQHGGVLLRDSTSRADKLSKKNQQCPRWMSLFLFSLLSVSFVIYLHSQASINANANPSANQALLFGISPPNNTTILQHKQTRRRKLHYCHWRPHGFRPFQMLTSPEFGFERIDIMENTNNNSDFDFLNDVDVIFGGYPHCGSKPWDWEMTSGLNAKLNQRGWDKLLPHQIWFPCMGCADSYCNKRELCRIQSVLDTTSCFVLPEQKNDLMETANENPDLKWVVKRDAATLHMHAGTGVQVIQNMDELPSDEQLSDGTYLVQPYIQPLVGSGKYQRKSEVRYYMAVTSVTPLRVYIYREPWVSLSPSLYNTNTTSKEQQSCMHDSHMHTRRCIPVQDKSLGVHERGLGLQDYGERAQIDSELIAAFQEEALTLLRDVFHNSNNNFMKNHHVNIGIDVSGASCFSFMRADFGISESGKPYLYEVNEFPFANEKHTPGQIQERAYRDFFYMIGISLEPPVPKDQRAEYEAKHRGGWILL